MIDITSQKVAIPAALFAALSPGVLLQLPDKIPGVNTVKESLFTMKTSQCSVLFHALVFMLVYRMVAHHLKIVLTPADAVVPAVLFVLLSPGFLLSVNPGSVAFRDGKTSMASVLIHTVVFAVGFALLRKNFPQFY
jgi:hypothetical protein